LDADERKEQTMPDKTPTWSVNPIALAELIIGPDLTKLISEKDPGQEIDLTRIREMLEKAFASRHEDAAKLELIFDSDGKTPARLDVFQQLADSLSKPQELALILKLPLVQDAIQLFGEEKIREILPYLAPVTDASFAPPGAEIPRGAPGVVGQWRALSAADYILSDTSYRDPRQGFVMDCYLISAMIALAWSRPQKWAEQVKKTGGPYRYRFHSPGAADPKITEVTPKLPLNKYGRLAYARSSTNDAEGWPGMFEKAYVGREFGLSDEPTPSDYQEMKNCLREPQVACHMLAGGASHSRRTEANSSQSEWLQNRYSLGATTNPTIAWTWDTREKMDSFTWTQTGLRHGHAYAVLGVMNRAQKNYVVLRDPWGWINPSQTHANGGPWTPDPAPNGVETVNLNAYGVFALQAGVFDKCFQAIGWVEINADGH
jgi:hypothetical protein